MPGHFCPAPAFNRMQVLYESVQYAIRQSEQILHRLDVMAVATGATSKDDNREWSENYRVHCCSRQQDTELR